MIIGIPKEIMEGELRVSAIPETVEKMVNAGAEVLLEAGAGAGAFYDDEAYRKVGAQIETDVAQLYQKADVILKVKEPQYNKEKQCSEIDLMHKGQYLITFIHPASPANHDMVRAMAQKGIIGLTLDGIPRITRAQSMDALTSMSTCAGYKGMIMAANDLAKFVPQIFCAVGMIKPINVFIIGAGVGGLQAIATAKRLGAVTWAADIRPEAAEQAASLGSKIVDTGVPAEIAVGEGGYARALPEEWLQKLRGCISETVANSDIVFCSALVPGKVAPLLVTEDMVAAMKPGSVIVDISIDQGGNCEITEPGKVVVHHGVTINGIKNVPGTLPVSSTWMFTNNIYNFFTYLVKDGTIALDRSDEIIRGTLVTIDGEIKHAGTLEAMKAVR